MKKFDLVEVGEALRPCLEKSSFMSEDPLTLACRVHLLLNGNADSYEYEAAKQRYRECYGAPANYDAKLHALNAIMDAYGVEAIRNEFDGGIGEPIAEYVNLGESYAVTVVYDLGTHEFVLASWADWYEAWRIRACDERGHVPSADTIRKALSEDFSIAAECSRCGITGTYRFDPEDIDF